MDCCCHPLISDYKLSPSATSEPVQERAEACSMATNLVGLHSKLTLPLSTTGTTLFPSLPCRGMNWRPILGEREKWASRLRVAERKVGTERVPRRIGSRP
jgi:hypothetical protein